MNDLLKDYKIKSRTVKEALMMSNSTLLITFESGERFSVRSIVRISEIDGVTPVLEPRWEHTQSIKKD